MLGGLKVASDSVVFARRRRSRWNGKMFGCERPCGQQRENNMWPETKRRFVSRSLVNLWMACLLLLWFVGVIVAQSPAASDPGVRGGTVDAGQPLDSLSQTPGGP